MKKLFSIVMILLLVITLTACDNEKVDKSTDAYRFKEDYESINGEDNGSGNKYRSLDIPIDNPFVYQTSEEIAERIDNKETFVVYFGFAKCPWCRSIIEQLIKSAKDNNIDKIYYVDVLDIRDTYRIDDEGVPQQTKAGTEGYMSLIEKMSAVLSDYTLTNDEEETIEVGEKRIYAPNIVAVVKGVPEKMVEGISEQLVDPYSELTDEMKEETYNSFKCLWECVSKGETVCKKNVC